MENFAIIAIAVFIAVLVLGPIFMIYLTKWSDRRKYHPGPRAFERASQKLREVVTVEKHPKVHPTAADNMSSEAVLCPICLAELFPSSGNRDGMGNAQGSKEKEPEGNETSTKAGIASSSTTATTRPSSSNSGEARGRAQPGQTVMTADEIVTLKRCGHSFHSRCLTTWFMIDRLDCPVCRARYWGEGQSGPTTWLPGPGRSEGWGRTDEEAPSPRTNDNNNNSNRAAYWGVVVL